MLEVTTAIHPALPVELALAPSSASGKDVGRVTLLQKMNMKQFSQNRSERADRAELWADEQIPPGSRRQ